MVYGLLIAAFAIAMLVWTPKTGKGIALYCGIVIGMWLIVVIAKYFR